MIERSALDIEKIDSSIVAKDGDVVFIENLEGLAKQNKLSIDISSLTFNDDTPASAAGLTVFKISAKTSGSWSGTYAFLSEIESLPYKVKITRYSAVTTGPSVGTDEKTLNNAIWSSLLELEVLKYK